LRHLHELCRGLPGRCAARQRLDCRHAAKRVTGCQGLRPMEKRKLLPVPQRAQLRHLLGCLPTQP
jgi:hypothetical protein